MKITMPFLFIFLLSLDLLSAEDNVSVTFELIQTTPEYKDIVTHHQKAYGILGLSCYLYEEGSKVALRRNDANSTEALRETVKLLERHQIGYAMIDLRPLPALNEPRDAFPFYTGYGAYERGDYALAERIFKRHHDQNPRTESAYALALVALKRHRYNEGRAYLEPYIASDKASKKLYYDLIVTQFYALLKRSKHDEAKALIERYIAIFPKLSTLKNEGLLSEAEAAADRGEFELAVALLESSELPQAQNYRFEIDYRQALSLERQGQSALALSLIIPYLETEAKARRFFEDVALAKAGEHLRLKAYEHAQKLLLPLLPHSQRARDLKRSIIHAQLMEIGWNSLETDPDRSWAAFNRACSVSNTHECVEGQMYAAYRQKRYISASSLAQALYSATQSQKAVAVAFYAALETFDYPSAIFWYERLHDKERFSDPYKLQALAKIDEKLRLGAFDQALHVSRFLEESYPDDLAVKRKSIEILLRLERFDEAKIDTQRLLERTPQDRYGLSVMALLHAREHRCIEALELYGRVGVLEPYERAPYLECYAMVAMERRDTNAAVAAIEALEQSEVKSGLYVLLAESLESRQNQDQIRAYKKALEYDPANFALAQTYLYRLKDFEEDNLFEKEYTRLEKIFRTPQQRQALTTIRHDYERSRLFSYYENRRFGLCYRYGNSVVKSLNDQGLERLHAWCAYYTDQFEEAQKLFADINLRHGQNAEDTYAFALSAAKTEQFDIATQALMRIEDQLDPKDRFKVAQLYSDIEQPERAKALLSDLPSSAERDALLTKINKSLKSQYRHNALSTGLHYKRREGEKGRHFFESYALPLDLHLYGDDAHFYMRTQTLYMYDGFLADSNGSYMDFGLGQNDPRSDLASDIGFYPTIGVALPWLTLELGSTPLGAKITPEPLWLLDLSLQRDGLGVHAGFVQKSIEDTMLSFVGERAEKGILEVNWGRALKRGFLAGISYDSLVTLSLDLEYYPWIHGLNLMENSEFKTVFGAIYHSANETLSYLDYGLIVVYDSYKYNSDLFTYGHGGYFSPQDFWMGNFLIDAGDTIASTLYWKLKASAGFQGYLVEDTERYPLSLPGVPLSGAIEPGYRTGGLSYKVAFGSGVRLSDHIDLTAAFSFEKMFSYELMQAGFSLVYFFDRKHNSALKNFEASHHLEKILY